jgi:hypothetical protein
MKKSLIICPSGNPIPEDADFWRCNHPDRLYETHVVCYNDFETDPKSYDQLHKLKGMKWSIAKQLLKTIDYTQYEYVGFLDDDLIITRDSLNKSLQIATALEAKIFQISVDKDSDCSYNILYQNDNLAFSETNFVEIMAPFIHTSVLPIVQKFWHKYDINTGWGFDSVLCNIVNEKALVIHSHNMIHPKKPVSDYDKAPAFVEQQLAMYQIYPQFMQEEYGIADAQIPSPQILRRWTKS